MALIMQHCRFLHTPKTGGVWVEQAVTNSGIVHARMPGPLKHVNLNSCPGNGLLTIAFVRCPWSWWKSYWVYKMHFGWIKQVRFDMDCISDHFETFIVNVLERRPGYWSQVCEWYCGPPDDEIDFVGRFEHLVDDLVSALSIAGERFDEARLRKTRPVNVGDYKSVSTRCSDELRARLLVTEAKGLTRFGYE